MTATLHVSVWRGGASGSLAAYDVPAQESQTVLDVVTYIQRHLEPTLSYRFACRVGMCGSCAMTVNGVPRWTCRTHVRRVASGGRLELRPLENLPVIKDLAVDMSDFFGKWSRAHGAFAPAAAMAKARSSTAPSRLGPRQGVASRSTVRNPIPAWSAAAVANRR